MALVCRAAPCHAFYAIVALGNLPGHALANLTFLCTVDDIRLVWIDEVVCARNAAVRNHIHGLVLLLSYERRRQPSGIEPTERRILGLIERKAVVLVAPVAAPACHHLRQKLGIVVGI